MIHSEARATRVLSQTFMPDKIAVFSACASPEKAEKIARLLVEQRLAACVSVIPGVRSYYRWKGALESAAECLLIAKTSRDRFAALASALERAHSYEVPEVVAVPIVDGSAKYLDWLTENSRQDSRD
jgi:periplasmic divalent cation tolerance protein